MRISFMGANLVAQNIGWTLPDWMAGEDAANAHYAPIATYEARLRETLERVKAAGFDAFDVWTAQLNWAWATDAHLAIARRVLDDLDLTVPSYAGVFGSTPDEFASACRVAAALGAPVLGGIAPVLGDHRDAAVAVLRADGLVLGLENHPDEHTPADILTKIGDEDHDVLGTAVDLGWWATQGYDAARAVRELGPHVVAVHLKDVRAAGAHETCVLGTGVVPVHETLAALDAIGYDGWLSIEHEPESGDPLPDAVESAARVRRWATAA